MYSGVVFTGGMNDEFYQEMPDYDGAQSLHVKSGAPRRKKKYNSAKNTERCLRWRQKHRTDRNKWMKNYMANRRKKENERVSAN